MTADKMRVEKTVTITGPGENRNYTESVRLFSREEIETLLQASGWESKFCYGDWDGNGHEDGISPRMIFVSSRVGGNS